MSKESKIILLIGAIVIGSIAILIAFVNGNRMDPNAIMQKVVREDSHKVGSGKVQVVEFGDFQCPACAQANPSVTKLKDEFKDDITFVFRNFPLPGHANAQPAAEAAEAAAAQGKYWEMHDKLYETQTQWASLADPTSIFSSYAESLGMDKEAFAKAVMEKANKSRISQDQSDGYAVGVSGTPTFFINGKQQAKFDYDSLKSAIQAELK